MPHASPSSATTTAWASARGPTSASKFGGKPNAIVAEIAGIDSLPLTQDRSRGFKDALEDCGLKVNNRVAADFTVAGGEAVASQLLAAAPHIDALWNHDDDQGVGVLAALDAAGPQASCFMVGGAGSKNAMEAIKADNRCSRRRSSTRRPRPPTAIRLARLLVQGKSLADLVEVEIPNRIVLFAPVVTKENVEKYLPDRVRILSGIPLLGRPPHSAARRPSAHVWLTERSTMTSMRVAMIGHGFMGAAHSQGWRVAPRFFDLLADPRDDPRRRPECGGGGRPPREVGLGRERRPTGARRSRATTST